MTNTTEENNGDEEKSLEEKIHERMVYPNPEGYILDALQGTLEIYRQTGNLRVLEGIEERTAEDRIYTYLLGAWAAHWIEVRDSAVCSVEQLEEDIDVTAEEIGEAVELGWVQRQNGKLRLKDAHVNEAAWYLVGEYV